MASLRLEFGIARTIAPGHGVSGDLEVVHYREGADRALVALIDGVGHGELAAATARLAADVILRRPHDPPQELLARCHAALRGTRGVVLSLASIDLQLASLSWLGVGNVTGVVCRRTAQLAGPDELTARPGLLGSGDIPSLTACVIPLRARDTLIFATDGISRHFPDRLPVELSPQDLADDIIAHHRAGNDDALVVVARAG